MYPVLSLSCVKRPDGSPMILCSVEFYHDSLEQLWIRDGDVLKSSFSNKSFNGFFSQQSYLIIPPQTFNDTIYSCWVNHSSLNKPLVANLSSSVCYESWGKFRAVTYFLFQCVIGHCIYEALAMILSRRCNSDCDSSVCHVDSGVDCLFDHSSHT